MWHKLKIAVAEMKASRKWRFIRWPYYGGGILLCFFIAAALVNMIVMPLVTRHGSEFPAPNVVGMGQREAQSLLLAHGLRMGIESRRNSPTVPERVIMGQVPPPQAMVKKGRRVMVTVSAGASTAVVPQLRGYTPRQAQLMIEEQGLTPGGETGTRDNSLPPGVVVSSIPTAGGEVPIGSVVLLMINEADTSGFVVVPILTGMSIKTAEARLEEQGLVLGAVYREADAVFLPGTVVRQSIRAGEQVRRGTSIDLTMTVEGR